MSKNIRLNDTDYTGVSTVRLLTNEGGVASFKDVDEIETPNISVTAGGLITAIANGKSATHQLSATDDADLIAENIREGKNIFGIIGTLATGGGTSEGAKIYNGTITTETGFATLEVEHNLGSRKLFWAISRDTTGDYTPVDGELILACGITPNVFLPDIDIAVGENTYNPWELFSAGNTGGYQAVGYILSYKNSTNGLNKAIIEKVAETYYPVAEQTDNKLKAMTGFGISGTKGTFRVTVIDLSSGQAVL